MRVEHQLCGGRPDVALAPEPRPSRPVPLPQTPAQRYAQTSSLASLAAATVALGLTRNPRRTANLLLAGLPRAARLGVEGFATQLDRIFAGRDVMVMDPAVLRRLDLIDTVVIDAPVLGDPPAGDRAPELAPAAAALIGSVRGAAQDLVIAGKSSPWIGTVQPDLTVAGGRALARSVRDLQAEGRVVAVVSGRPGSALMAADLGIGIVDAGQPHPPWGAHVICLSADDAPAVVDATRLARTAGRQSAAISGAGSLVGSLLALGPLPGAGRRAVTAVQLASLVAMAAGGRTATRLPGGTPSRVTPGAPAGPGAEEPGAEDPGPVGPEVGAAADAYTEAAGSRPWHALAVPAALAELGTGLAGLTATEAAARYRPYAGPGSPRCSSGSCPTP